MLTPEIAKKISDFVIIKPRTVEEIAKHIGKNWRTADSYIKKIAEQQGTIAVRTFREGTRGALKIVYWRSIEQMHSTGFRAKLLERIKTGRRKQDFSPFDIYQYVDAKKKSAFMEEQEDEAKEVFQDITRLLRTTEKQLFIFSGNLSWANLIQDKTKILDVFEELAKRNVSIKILTRVELAGLNNIKRVLAINSQLGRNAIEIKHMEQPLRAIIIDNKLAQFKEMKDPSDYKKEELKKKMFIFYTIYDPDWIEWIQKSFWNMFANAIPAEKRIKEIMSIQKI